VFKEKNRMPYKVFVDDNYNYMDEAERYLLGEFLLLEEAILACREIVDEHLLSVYHSGMNSESLLKGYKLFGEDPYIASIDTTETKVLFSAWAYAEQRCKELCEQNE
jgi:hypothetical protein